MVTSAIFNYLDGEPAENLNEIHLLSSNRKVFFFSKEICKISV